jgi:hypothetical protein
MDTTLNYIQTIKNALKDSIEGSYDEEAGQHLKDELVFDDERRRYLVITTGRDKGKTVFEVTTAIKLQEDGKILIEHCSTEDDFRTIFIDEGIPASDIAF